MAFTLLDTLDVGGATQDNYLRGSYIHLANQADGVRAMTYAGGVLASVGNYNPSGHVYNGIYVDESDVIYAVRWSSGWGWVDVLTFDGAAYTLQDTSAVFQSGISDMRIWGDGTYVYVATGFRGLRAFEYIGGNITLKATYSGVEGRAGDVYCSDGYIFTGNGGEGFSALTFNGVAFTLIDHVDDLAYTETDSIFFDGTILHQRTTGVSKTLRAHSFVGGNFNLEETLVMSSETFTISGMWGANGLIFLADSDDIKVFSYDAGAKTYTLVDGHASGTIAYGVHGKPGDYVVLSNFENGIRLYSWPVTAVGQIILFT